MIHAEADVGAASLTPASSLSAALDWIERHRQEFSIFADPTDRTVDAGLIERLKPIGELLLMIAHTDGGQLPGHSDLRRRWLDWAWDQFGHGDLLVKLLAARPDLIPVSAICASFARCGYEIAGMRESVTHVLTSTSFQASELPPWRKLEVGYIKRSTCNDMSLGGSFTDPGIFQQTWIAARPEPWLITDDNAYAATHAIFYATDFGRWPIEVADELRSYLELWLPVWLDIYKSKADFDIFAELLMVAAYTELSEVYNDGLPALMAHQQATGAFSGIHAPGSNRAAIDPRSNFRTRYHTTIVSVMALTAGERLDR